MLRDGGANGLDRQRSTNAVRRRGLSREAPSARPILTRSIHLSPDRMKPPHSRQPDLNQALPLEGVKPAGQVASGRLDHAKRVQPLLGAPGSASAATTSTCSCISATTRLISRRLVDFVGHRAEKRCGRDGPHWPFRPAGPAGQSWPAGSALLRLSATTPSAASAETTPGRDITGPAGRIEPAGPAAPKRSGTAPAQVPLPSGVAIKRNVAAWRRPCRSNTPPWGGSADRRKPRLAPKPLPRQLECVPDLTQRSPTHAVRSPAVVPCRQNAGLRGGYCPPAAGARPTRPTGE